MKDENNASFLVRLWKEKGKKEWRGEIEHIQSGEKNTIKDIKTIGEILERKVSKDLRTTINS